MKRSGNVKRQGWNRTKDWAQITKSPHTEKKTRPFSGFLLNLCGGNMAVKCGWQLVGIAMEFISDPGSLDHAQRWLLFFSKKGTVCMTGQLTRINQRSAAVRLACSPPLQSAAELAASDTTAFLAKVRVPFVRNKASATIARHVHLHNSCPEYPQVPREVPTTRNLEPQIRVASQFAAGDHIETWIGLFTRPKSGHIIAAELKPHLIHGKHCTLERVNRRQSKNRTDKIPDKARPQ